MAAIPMNTQESRDQELITQFFVCVVRGNVGDGVMEKQRIARRAVDGAVEDMDDYFALEIVGDGVSDCSFAGG